jgi:hypothetical protein
MSQPPAPRYSCAYLTFVAQLTLDELHDLAHPRSIVHSVGTWIIITTKRGWEVASGSGVLQPGSEVISGGENVRSGIFLDVLGYDIDPGACASDIPVLMEIPGEELMKSRIPFIHGAGISPATGDERRRACRLVLRWR